MGKLSIKKISKIFALCSVVIFAVGVLLPHASHAVPLAATTGPTWTALPPYNTLWPLWSPSLSPIDPVTLLPVPIVSDLAPSTVLPLQPGLTLDPRKSYPYLLYNTPLGMAYYDPLWGVNLWPAPDLVDPVLGIPLPIDLSLILGWSTIAPTSSTWLLANVPVANSAYYNAYDAFAVAYEISLGGTLATYPLFASLINPAPAYSSLLTPLLILGP
ncbi:MAG: hypothetical protein ACMUJM_06215 [bacterium]